MGRKSLISTSCRVFWMRDVSLACESLTLHWRMNKSMQFWWRSSRSNLKMSQRSNKIARSITKTLPGTFTRSQPQLWCSSIRVVRKSAKEDSKSLKTRWPGILTALRLLGIVVSCTLGRLWRCKKANSPLKKSVGKDLARLRRELRVS